jgi:hypothetical protein
VSKPPKEWEKKDGNGWKINLDATLIITVKHLRFSGSRLHSLV